MRFITRKKFKYGMSLLLMTGVALFWFSPSARAISLKDLPLVNKFLGPRKKVAQASDKVALPKKFNLKVPFTPQAPFAKWVLPYEEACEETAALIVHYFHQKKEFTPDTADYEILKLVEWQKLVYGDYIHTTVDQTARLIKDYLGYKNVRVIEKPTIDDIKREIVAGHPVIVPAAGRLLGNKYFKRPGPIYHMYVITGYNGREFITNEPGTRRGFGYRYFQDKVMDTMHDWAGSDETITYGRKAVIVVYPNDSGT